MTFASIAGGTSVFVDANTFVYAFAPDPQLGPPCEELLERIERGDLQGYTSAHVLADTAHRLMSLDACAMFGSPYAGIAARMQRHPTEVRQLTRFRQALEGIQQIGVRAVPVFERHVFAASALSQQFGILTNDAIIVAVMQESGLVQIASHDADSTRFPG